jgi:aryl-alcohol dehydrogenase-like predicted oxidoreductase
MAKLGLGTAQFGMDYGISNRVGQTSSEEVLDILQTANSNNIGLIDTAHLYGSSEEILGSTLSTLKYNSIQIITKTPRFNKKRIRQDDAEYLKKTFNESLKKLRRSAVEGLLIHNSEDLLTPGASSLYKEMQNLKCSGKVMKLGVSVYTPQQLDRVLENYDLELVQLPINIFDQRFIQSGHLMKLKNKAIEIHVRSVFLQGLLLMSVESIPAYFSPILKHIERLQKFMHDIDLSLSQGALCFVRQQNEVNTVIVGINNNEQLRKNIEDFSKISKLHFDFSSFSIDDESMINPSLWKIR